MTHYSTIGHQLHGGFIDEPYSNLSEKAECVSCSITATRGCMDELRVSNSFLIRAQIEPVVQGIALACEQETKHRKTPVF